MTLMDILPNSAFESRQIECKAILSDDVASWIKTVCGFANAEGGTLYVGVEDKSFRLIGFEHDEIDAVVSEFQNRVNEHISPRIRPYFDYLKYSVRGKERYIIAARIMESEAKPVVATFSGLPSIYMRGEARTYAATQEEITKMVLSSKRVQFDSQSTYVPFDISKYKTLAKAYKERTGEELTPKLIEGQGLLDEEKNVLEGLSLFADDYDGDACEVRAGYFSTYSKGADEIPSFKWFKGNILDSISFMRKFIETYDEVSYIKTAEGREEHRAYSPRCVLEALVNAVVHRDYFVKGSQIQIDMFPDRLEITSPGGFYYGNFFHQERDLRRIISKRRNEVISKVFMMLRMMESGGTGFDRIVDDYSSADLAHKPFVTSRSESFTLVLPNRLHKPGLSYEALGELKLRFNGVENPSRHDYAILSACFFSYKDVKEIAGTIGVSPSTYFREEVANLLQQGYLVEKKEGRTVFFTANKEKVFLE